MSIAALNWALDCDPGSASRKLVLMVLANYADEHGRAWPSQTTIAKKACLTDRSVRTALAELERDGFIERRKRGKRPDGTNLTDVLVLDLTCSTRKNLPHVEHPENPSEAPGNRRQNHPEAVSGKPSLGNHHKNHSEANASGTAVAAPPELPLRDRLWLEGVAALVSLGTPRKQAASVIGRWLRDHDGDAGRVLWAIEEAVAHGSGDPIPYVTRLLSERKSGNVASFGAHPSRRSGSAKDDNIAAAVAEFSGGRRERPGSEPGHNRGRYSGEAGDDVAGPYDADSGAKIAYLRAHH